MTSRSHRLLECLGEAFLAGRLDYVASNFAFPMPLFQDGDLVVFGTAEMMVEGLQMYLDEARQYGTARLRPRVIAEGIPARNHSSVWVEWDHCGADGTCLRTSQVRYVLYQDHGQVYPKIEAADY
ncbi:MAG: hypothetical protein AAFY39_09055, partial [Pseudomonadota bacterium]